MGKKHPLAAVQKQKPGLDIKRFLERKEAQAGKTDGVFHGHAQGCHHVAGIRPPGRTATPGRPLDNILLSQDVDDVDLKVVWASSPAAGLSPQKGSAPSQERKEGAGDAAQRENVSLAGAEGFRRTLIEAIQGSAITSEGQGQEQVRGAAEPSRDFLEQLLARRSSHGAASTSAPSNPAVGQPTDLGPGPALHYAGPVAAGPAAAGAARDDDHVMQEVLAGTDTYKTPAVARAAGARALRGGGNRSVDAVRSALCSPSALTLGGRKRTLLTSARKAASGNKRRALADLLDQVELMVKQREEGDGEEGPEKSLQGGGSGAGDGLDEEDEAFLDQFFDNDRTPPAGVVGVFGFEAAVAAANAHPACERAVGAGGRALAQAPVDPGPAGLMEPAPRMEQLSTAPGAAAAGLAAAPAGGSPPPAACMQATTGPSEVPGLHPGHRPAVVGNSGHTGAASGLAAAATQPQQTSCMQAAYGQGTGRVCAQQLGAMAGAQHGSAAAPHSWQPRGVAVGNPASDGCTPTQPVRDEDRPPGTALATNAACGGPGSSTQSATAVQGPADGQCGDASLRTQPGRGPHAARASSAPPVLSPLVSTALPSVPAAAVPAGCVAGPAGPSAALQASAARPHAAATMPPCSFPGAPIAGGATPASAGLSGPAIGALPYGATQAPAALPAVTARASSAAVAYAADEDDDDDCWDDVCMDDIDAVVANAMSRNAATTAAVPPAGAASAPPAQGVTAAPELVGATRLAPAATHTPGPGLMQRAFSLPPLPMPHHHNQQQQLRPPHLQQTPCRPSCPTAGEQPPQQRMSQGRAPASTAAQAPAQALQYQAPPPKPPLHPTAQQPPLANQPAPPHRLPASRCSSPQPAPPVQPHTHQQPQQQAYPQVASPTSAQARPSSREAAGAAVAPPPPRLLGGREDVHMVVLEVEQPHDKPCKILRCFNEYKGEEVHVYLTDMWADEEVCPGDPVNVVGGKPMTDPARRGIELSRNEGLLILHPDVLLSGTSIVSAMRCGRQAWLQERIAGGPGGERALLGSCTHELLQRSLAAALEGRLDRAAMLAEARAILASHTDSLVEAGQDEAAALASLTQQVDALLGWCAAYVTPSAAAPAGGRILMPAGGGGPGGAGCDGPTFCRVEEVVDIEESIWAPRYGLKGQLDASLRVTISRQDPLHNQRTLAGGYASAHQQHQQQAAQQGHQQWGQPGCGPAPHHATQQPGPFPHPRPQWHQQRRSDGGAPFAPQPLGQGQGPGQGQGHPWAASGSGPDWQQGQQAQAQGPGQLRRQHSWSAGMAQPEGPGQPPGAQRPPQQWPPLPPGFMSETAVVPFEFKSGKFFDGHRAQVLLYLLLMEDRYQSAVRTGLLWHSNNPEMAAVRYTHTELAGLIMHRNHLASYLVGTAPQPPPPKLGSESDRVCNYCPVRAVCALHLAADVHAPAAGGSDGGGEGKDVGAGSTLQQRQRKLAEMDIHPTLREALGGVRPAHAAFFAHWARLVDLEEAAARAGRADMWAITGQQREQQGGCIAGLVFRRQVPPPAEQDAGDGPRFCYDFARANGTAAAVPSAASPARQGGGQGGNGAGVAEPGDDGGLLCCSFAPGDMGLLGVEGRHAAAARVTVVAVTRDTITLSCRKELRLSRLAGEDAAASPHPPPAASDPRVATWRLDRDEPASCFAQMRLNLALLGVRGAGCGWQSASGGSGGKGDGGKGGSGGAGASGSGGLSSVEARREGILQRLRELVIGLEAPQQGVLPGSLSMSSQASGSQLSCPGGNAYLRSHAHLLNPEQLEAVQRALAMRDYALLLGMPGTGKTTTIVHIIRALVEVGVSVLVSSYTNSAVDNILLKLAGGPVPFVRLGSRQAVHPAVRRYMPGGKAWPDTSAAGLRETMTRAHVVGCTCLSAHGPLLAGRTFGCCILDEASQVTLPASLGPLALARSFLLVGDHYQLSPLVSSREAAAGGLGVSLFRRLSEAHPQAVVTLRSQYRMCADIMALSNALVYSGRLRCGSEAVANAALQLPLLHTLTTPAHTSPRGGPTNATVPAPAPRPWPASLPLPPWLAAALQPSCRVLFLDTDGAGGCREAVLRDGVANPGEVRIVHALAAALVAAGLPPHDIGVASPYKAQVAALAAALAGLAPPAAAAAAADGTGCEVGGGGGHAAAACGPEVLTVDKYQGRDKPAVLLSFVRSNAGRSAGRLLADWQRLNVALTRARTKLLLVGSGATLAAVPLLADMLARMRRRGWVERLPADCLAGLPEVPGA